MADAGNGCVVVIVMMRSEVEETVDWDAVRFAYREPGDIARVIWEIPTMRVRSGLRTEPKNGEVLPAIVGFLIFLTLNSNIVSVST